MTSSRWPRLTRSAAWLATGICIAVAMLAWFGFSASREVQRSSQLLVQRRSEEAAQLLATALTRDMRAAQVSVLSSPIWDDFAIASPHDATALVASAFARYPYPEAFFAWDGRATDGGVVFYTRSDRPPAWAPEPAGPNRYPVRTLTDNHTAATLVRAMRDDVAASRSFSIAQLELSGAAFQVVTQIRYRDRLRQHVHSARGFLVSLPWVRQHYFPELTRQVAEINGETPGLVLSVKDSRGDPVVGRRVDAEARPVSQRHFPIAFFDPGLVAVNKPANLTIEHWTVLASGAGDPALGAALRGADVLVWFTALSAVILALGLGVTARAMRSAFELAEMRADFMSSVTHELKTPIASIRAMGDTLTRGRLRDASVQQEYAAVVVQEAKRLARLVDNVLAHSRITDVAEVYSFEPLEVEELVASAVAGFRQQLQRFCYVVTVTIPPELPPVRADRSAMELLLDNLLDNAIRHAGTGRSIVIGASATATTVAITLSDNGPGIDPDELGRVSHKFVRGRHAGAGGSGLGLAIVTKIVADHGGTFAIESRRGAGTVVTVTLPVAAHHRVASVATSWRRADA